MTRRAAAAPPAALAGDDARAPRAARWAARLGALAGWRRLGAAALLGLVSSLAFAPLWALPLLLPAFTGLVWLLQGAARGRAAFAVGWAFGVGHFLGGLYWVGIAMTVDFARFWWFLPISVGGLALGLSLFLGLATWLTWASRTRGFARLLVLATAWMAAEWLRSWVLTGFPWNQLGSVWAFAAWPIQFASVAGIYGLSLLTLLAAAAPALLGESGLGKRHRRGGLAAAWGAMGAALLFGLLRVQGAPPPGSDIVPEVGLRLVQPSVQQTLKWRADLRSEHVERLIELTQRPAGSLPITHVIWPETAIPFNLWLDIPLRQRLGQVVVPPGGLLMTGAPRYQQGLGSWNSLYAIDETGRIAAVYDKAHLVPFGEYVPFRAFLGSLDITVTQGSFDAGPGPTTLALPGLPPASPLICYEIIFSGAVTAEGAEPPAWILNITNDAWFGRSSGPFQHYAQARLRAVEEGLPLVRSANNGISAVLDPYGRPLGELGLDAVGVLDLPLPRALDRSTFYSTLGASLVVLLLLLPAIVAALWAGRRPKLR